MSSHWYAIALDGLLHYGKKMIDKIRRTQIQLLVADSWKDFVSALDKSKIIQAPFCGNEDCEDKIKDMSKANVEVEPGAPSMGAKSLCIPFIDNQLKQLDPKSQPCVFPGCKTPPQFYTLFGRSY